MFVGCPITSSPFTLHKPMNNESFPNPNPNPIKRTLSADTSSPNWLQINSISSPLKRAHSSDRLNAPFEQEEQQLNKQILASEDDQKKCAFEAIWNSILTQNNGSGSGHLPPPYVHPMVKRASSLTEKSLEICTESLGSETGSCGFSFPVSSEPDGTEKGSETTQDHYVEQVTGPNEEVNGSSPTLSLSLSLSPRVRSSFPPPMPSLASPNGSNLHLKSHRQNGRLVLEAVAVPSQNCLKAQRHDGRLLLTFTDDEEEEDNVYDYDSELEDVLEVDNDDELEEIECCYGYQEMEKEVDDNKVEIGDRSCLNSPMGMVNVQQGTTPALIMSKFKWLSTTRTRNVNITIVNDKAEVDQQKSLLPPRPKMAHDGPMSMDTSNSVLNGYEYYWRQTATAIGMLKPLARQQNLSAAPQVVENESKYMSKLLLEHNSEKSYNIGQETQDVVVVKAIETRTMKGDHQREKEGEYLVPFLKGCKESKRSLLLWGPHCIATS